MNKWDERFLKLAGEVSTWSKDPSTKVGAVVALDNRVLGCGYNGFPPSIDDRSEWLDDRETKYKLVIHAEINAILDALHRHSLPLDNCTLYLSPLAPCGECAKIIAAAGIRRVVCIQNDNPRWSTADAKFLFEKAGIKFEIY